MRDGTGAADLTGELRVTYVVKEVFSHVTHEARLQQKISFD